MNILILNAGSSSEKCALYPLERNPPSEPVWTGTLDWAQGGVKLLVKVPQGVVLANVLPCNERAHLLTHLLKTLWSGPHRVLEDPSAIAIVGHRVVHGGPDYRESTLVTPRVQAAIDQYTPFAPNHNPAARAGMAVIEQLLPDTPQVAVFDTAFHRTLPPTATLYPGPYSWLERGIFRYGFHGISHEYAAQQTAYILGQELEHLRLIVCHLGHGSSLAAIHRGQSIDTTMGFTPLEGLMMGTRSGSVDPGVLIHLIREDSLDADALDRLLNQESGLLGISGRSGDMRDILEGKKDGDPRAVLAFDLYIHHVRAYIGAMLAALGGVDALVFTGGVAEQVCEVRAKACAAFAFLGLTLDAEKNARSPQNQDIAAPDSKVRVVLVQACEAWVIARECWRLSRVLGLQA
ncbi:acetate/propionate family kinase [Anthocerotibacter panamensis]|uniref:acetate/propionate family kinase n=1 Tax=Anthocerotibacter panamensis TaxID=2857077 RepID=UPI001C4081B2|nr:acetate kinase [Anthocerotibacter panamensis]